MNAAHEQAERVLTCAHEILAQEHNKPRSSWKGENQPDIDTAENKSFLNIAAASRYLRAYGDERRAARSLASTYLYRSQLGIAKMGTGSETANIIRREMQKRSLFIGAVSDGSVPPSPVLILRKKRESFDMADFDDYRRVLFFTLECTARLADSVISCELTPAAATMSNSGCTTVTEIANVAYDDKDGQLGQWVIVMDMNGYKRGNSPPMSVTLETMRIFQRHFPERAKRIVILDAPAAFYLLWRIVNPLIDAVTRKKFVFLSRADGEDSIKRAVGPVVFNCIDLDLEEGKRISEKIMCRSGLLSAPTDKDHGCSNTKLQT